ncbi:MAG: type II toxin-antitoxin system Phd/YefM family antitoxin [Hormoscilla sp.]
MKYEIGADVIMPQLDIADANSCLSELIEKAIAGEEVMITRDN